MKYALLKLDVTYQCAGLLVGSLLNNISERPAVLAEWAYDIVSSIHRVLLYSR